MPAALRLLVIDDSEDDVALVVRKLRQDGYEPTCRRVDSPADLSAALDEPVAWDAVLCDSSVPNLDPATALRAVREHQLDIPFVIVSSRPVDAGAALAAGVEHCLTKDDLTQLVPILQRSLGHAEARRLARATPPGTGDLERLFALSRDMLCVAGLDGYFKRVNPAFERTLGFATAELLAQPFIEFVHPDDRAATLAETQKLANGTATLAFENRYRCADGTYRWLEWTSYPVPAEGLLYAVARDVTERRRLEEALRTSAGQIQDLYDKAPCGYHSLDSDGTFVAINATELRWLGYTRDELIGRMKFSDLLTSRSVAVFWENFPRFKERGWVKDLEFELVRKDGTVLPVLLSATAVTDPAGRYLMSRSTVFDVTRRKRAERALRRSEERLASIINNSPAVIYLKDAQGRYLLINRRYEALFHVTNAEIAGKTDYDLFPREVADALRRNDQEVLAAAAPLEFEEVVPHDGDRHTYISIKFPLLDAKGAAYAVGGISTDITERKRLADTLAATNRELEAFSYSISHDLRAPLRSIAGFSEALLEDYADAVDDAGRELLERIAAATRRMGELIEDLLGLARVSRHELQVAAVDLSGLARQVAAELRERDPGRAVDFVIQEHVVARGDARLLRVVFENLLGNAWKYTSKQPAARIEFGVLADGVWPMADGQNREAGRGGGDHMPSARSDVQIFFVRDNGAGFDPAYASKLFGPFQRLHSAAEFEGTGIGLAIVQRIIHRHGGRVWAEGAPDAGATVSFTLPRQRG